MSNEITLGCSLKVDKFTQKAVVSRTVSGLRVDMSGSVVSAGTQLIGTTKEMLELRTDHATPGIVYMRNLDADNFLSYGVDADTPFGEMKAGEPAQFRLSRSQSSISIKADTAAVWVDFVVVED